jgi:RimJ/RimL family protein N-acetyltransferase
MTIRLLNQSDAGALEAFLVQHRDSSMFLRSNARRGGLDFQGQVAQAEYVAAFQGGAIVAVAAHSWSGMILVQAPEQVEAVAQGCVAKSGRKVSGFSGPLEQVRRARAALGLAEAPTQVDLDDRLYALDLEALIVPAALSSGTVVCRAPRPEERELLVAWRLAYDIELLGGADTEEQRGRAAGFLDGQIAQQNAWVALANGVLASLSAFSASLPDIVQLGGIYTPPELRGRGYAKCAVAGSLLAARERGALRAVLFTQNPSAARCYEAVGFRQLGEYGLVLLR